MMIAALPYFPLGMAVGALSAMIFRVIPVSWLLDYGETDATAAGKAQRDFTFFPGMLILMLIDGLLFWCGRQYIGLQPRLPIILYITQPLLLIILSDLKTRIIPDQFILALLPGSLLLWLSEGLSGTQAWGSGILKRILAALLAGLLLWGCGWLASRLLKREAMGMGDVKLLAACAFITGLGDLPFLFILSFVSAAFVALPLLISRLWRPASPEIAFGPYIALATLLLLYFNDFIQHAWQTYLALLP